MNKPRLHTLDYLRGIAATLVMFYHYHGFVYGHYSAQSFWGRAGLYAVSIFYILSGLTLFYVYRRRFELKDFVIKRIFRIYPLLWLATLSTIAILGMKGGFVKLGLNLSGLFGFVAWDKYFAMGAWSIGNELVFYALFPPVLFFLRRNLAWVPALVAAVLFTVFSFFLLNTQSDIVPQWKTYVNPLNQAPYFIIGMLMGYWGQNIKVGRLPVFGLIAAACVLFVVFPTGENRAELVSGVGRIAFTAIITALCFAFYKLEWQIPFLHKPLSILGEASYSIYLLHPLVWHLLGKKIGGGAGIGVSGLITVAGSYLVYLYFEKYFVAVGKRFTTKKEKTQREPEPAL